MTNPDELSSGAEGHTPSPLIFIFKQIQAPFFIRLAPKLNEHHHGGKRTHKYTFFLSVCLSLGRKGVTREKVAEEKKKTKEQSNKVTN